MTALLGLTWTPPGGSPLDLNDGGDYLLVALSGAGIPDVLHTTEKTPRRRGETYIRSVLEPRMLELEIALSASTWALTQAAKQTFIASLVPEDGLGVLKYTPVAGGQAYAIDCILEDGGGFSRPISPQAELLALTMRCPDPAWYDPDETEVELQVPNVGITFPLVFPLSIGTRMISVVHAYVGTVPVWPSFSVPGPFTTLYLVNVTTGKELRLPTIAVASGETLVIDMWERTVKVDGVSVLSSMNPDSTFWRLERGDNTVTVRTAVDAPLVTMTYNKRFAGI